MANTKLPSHWFSWKKQMIHCSIHDSIKEVDPGAWNEIVPEGCIFQTYEALRFIEEKGVPEYTPSYFIFRNQKRQIIAHTTAYIIKTDLLIFSKGLIKNATSMVRSHFPGFLFAKILECGIPISPGNPIIIRKDQANEEIVKQLNFALQAVAKVNGIQLIVLRDFYNQDSFLFPLFNAAGFQMIRNLPTTELEIRWHDYPSYVGSMRSSYRSKLKRHRKIANQSHFAASFTSNFSDIGLQLAAQWKNVHELAREYSREKLTPDFYTYINEGLKGKCRLLKITQGNLLKAHALLAIDSPVLRWLYFGREAKGLEDGAYFFALEQIIQLGIKLGVEKIEMGLTSYTAKSDYGAKMIPLHMFVKCRTRFMNHIIPKLYNLFNHTVSIQDRNVFNE